MDLLGKLNEKCVCCGETAYGDKSDFCSYFAFSQKLFHYKNNIEPIVDI